MITNEKEIAIIEEALNQYSCYFIDWEEMYYTPGYKPDFPVHLKNAIDILRAIKTRTSKNEH